MKKEIKPFDIIFPVKNIIEIKVKPNNILLKSNNDIYQVDSRNSRTQLDCNYLNPLSLQQGRCDLRTVYCNPQILRDTFDTACVLSFPQLNKSPNIFL